MVIKKRKQQHCQQRVTDATHRASARKKKKATPSSPGRTPLVVSVSAGAEGSPGQLPVINARPSSAYSDSSDEGGTLRELYAAKQQLAGAIDGGSKPAPGSPLARGSLRIFDNPLAEIEESTEEGESPGAAPTTGGAPIVAPPCSSPPPSVLAGWFAEARTKFAEKRKKLERGGEAAENENSSA